MEEDKVIENTEPIKQHVKYKETIKKCQKRWAQSERGRKMTARRSLKYYYRKNNIYHPEFNIDGEDERKYKRNVEIIS